MNIRCASEFIGGWGRGCSSHAAYSVEHPLLRYTMKQCAHGSWTRENLRRCAQFVFNTQYRGAKLQHPCVHVIITASTIHHAPHTADSTMHCPPVSCVTRSPVASACIDVRELLLCAHCCGVPLSVLAQYRTLCAMPGAMQPSQRAPNTHPLSVLWSLAAGRCRLAL